MDMTYYTVLKKGKSIGKVIFNSAFEPFKLRWGTGIHIHKTTAPQPYTKPITAYEPTSLVRYGAGLRWRNHPLTASGYVSIRQLWIWQATHHNLHTLKVLRRLQAASDTKLLYDAMFVYNEDFNIAYLDLQADIHRCRACKHKVQHISKSKRCKPCDNLATKERYHADIEASRKYSAIASKKYNNQHPDRARAKRRNQQYKRRTRKKKGNVTADQWTLIKQLFNHQCAYCDKSLKRFHMDHFIALSKGGPHIPTNVVPACPRCNISKKDRSPREYINDEQRYEFILTMLGEIDSRLDCDHSTIEQRR